MEKILYLSPVDWDWIKQRPQFLAEALCESYDMQVLYRKQYNRSGLQHNSPHNVLKIQGYRTLPSLCDRVRASKSINSWLTRLAVKKALKKGEFDWIWITHPTQLVSLPKDVQPRIVYDCMDDYLEIGCQENDRPWIFELEKTLCERANLVFASSIELKKRIESRYGLGEKVHLISNGCKWQESIKARSSDKCENDTFKIMYIGTISEWFDFNLIEESLKEIQDIEYELAGPINIETLPNHDRIKYCGVVPHEKLPEFVEHADCLVMPFARNSLVTAVDPVKLYEYISFRKNILCLGYPETEKFKEFACLYSNKQEYIEKLQGLMDNRELRYTGEDADRFLAENSWKNRAEQIKSLLNRDATK